VHRLAVLDRLYYGDASRKHLQTLHLLDASVRRLRALVKSYADRLRVTSPARHSLTCAARTCRSAVRIDGTLRTWTAQTEPC